MALYEYRCESCGPFLVTLPMGQAPALTACPDCEDRSPRVYSPPSGARTPSALASLAARAEASAREPAVVTRSPDRHRQHRQPHRPWLPQPAIEGPWHA